MTMSDFAIHQTDRTALTPLRTVGLSLVCVARTAWLLVRGKLHIDHSQDGRWALLPDGRTYEIFRRTTSSAADEDAGELVTLAVWFHLRLVPAWAQRRRTIFERESILNTLLFAGFAGYVSKLWMVDPETNEFAGLYEWRGREEAERYAHYITSVLRPLSSHGRVGWEIRSVKPAAIPAAPFEREAVR
jgi:hypothetical protein